MLGILDRAVSQPFFRTMDLVGAIRRIGMAHALPHPAPIKMT